MTTTGRACGIAAYIMSIMEVNMRVLTFLVLTAIAVQAEDAGIQRQKTDEAASAFSKTVLDSSFLAGDADADAQLSRTEFASSLTELRRIGPHERTIVLAGDVGNVEASFTAGDVDGNAALDRKEYALAVNDLYSRLSKAWLTAGTTSATAAGKQGSHVAQRNDQQAGPPDDGFMPPPGDDMPDPMLSDDGAPPPPPGM